MFFKFMKIYPTSANGSNSTLTVQPKEGLKSKLLFGIGLALLFLLLTFKVAIGQSVIYNSNFGTVNVTTSPLQAGWTTSGTAANAQLSTGSVSSTYTTPVAFSAGANLADLGTTISTAQVDVAGVISTVGFSSIQVLWGARASSATYTGIWSFSWSSDGITYNPIAYTDITRNGTWALVNGGVFINLPAGAAGQSNLRFRIGINRTSTGGNYRIDDFIVRGISASPTINVTAGLTKFFANHTYESEPQTMIVSGNNLSADIQIGPLAGYQFSTVLGGPYGNSITISPSSGTVSSTNVYVILSASNAVGTYAGNISLSSTGATTQNVAATGQVYGNGTGNFTAGNIVTLRVGEAGGPALSGVSTAIFLDEYTPAGVFVQSKPLPFSNGALGSGNRAFSLSGSATSEGYLNLSPDGQYLTFGGYNTAPGLTGVASTSAASVNRLVARVTQNGTINTSTRINDGYNANNIRSAATVDGSAFWTGGAGGIGVGGTRYVTLGNTGASVSISSGANGNTRGTAIYNSQLFCSAAAGSNIGINTVGSGLPTITGQTTTMLSGTTNNTELTGPHGFVFVDVDDDGNPDVLYVADVNLGLNKFSNSGGVWTKRGSLPNSSGRAIYGVTAYLNGSNRDVLVCMGTSTAISTEIYKFSDVSAVSANITSSGTDIISACGGSALITAPANVGFKGVSFAPVNVPTPTVDFTFSSPAPLTAPQGTTNKVLYQIQADITVGNALLTGITAQTAGFYAASDIVNFRLIVSTDAVLDGSDPILSTISTSTGPGQTLAFTGLGQNLPIGTTRYLFITATISGCATIANTLSINSIPLSNITFGNPATVKNGTPSAGAANSIAVGLPNDVTGFSASSGEPTVTLNWTNPGCLTEVVIVASKSPIGSLPTGSYTANSNFTLAPLFNGGPARVVYVGSASPQVITGLSLNQTYYFKAFVKNAGVYSLGVQVSATPTLTNIYSRGSGISHSDPIWSLLPTGTPQTLAAIGGMSPTRGLVIQSGHSVQLSTSGGTVVCRELIVQSGAILTSTGTTEADNKFLQLFGNVTNNGIIGTGAIYNPICFAIEGNSVTLQGAGIYDVARIRKNTNTNVISNLIFNANVNLWFGSGAALYNNQDNTRLNYQINAGKTVHITQPGGDFALDGADGNNGTERAGNLIVNGHFMVGGTIFARNDNVTPGYSCAITTGNTGKITTQNFNSNFTTGLGTTLTLATGSQLNVKGTLTVASGTLVSNGALRLISNASGTARIANSAGSISGNVVVERYVPVRGWHFTGSALGGQTILEWNDDFYTQGPMPGVKIPNPGSNTSSIFQYNQAGTINDGLSQFNGWEVPTSSALDPLARYEGYRVFIPHPLTLDNVGPVSLGDKTLNLDWSGSTPYKGYNLRINPHLSAFNWSSATRNNVDNTVVIWDPSSNTYKYFGSDIFGGNLGLPTAAINPIASGQAFFIRANGPAPSITIPEAAKVSGGSFFRSATSQNQVFKIELSNTAGERDEALFNFINDATPGHDPKYDAGKWVNPSLNIYTLTNEGHQMAINAIPFEGTQMVVGLGFEAPAGAHSLHFSGLSALENVFHIYLKDNKLNVLTSINAEGNYAFTVNESGADNHRFELIFTSDVTSAAQETKVKESMVAYPNPAIGDWFYVAMANMQGLVKLELVDMLGRKIHLQEMELSQSMDYVKMAKPGQAGQYMLKITSANMVKTIPVLVR